MMLNFVTSLSQFDPIANMKTHSVRVGRTSVRLGKEKEKRDGTKGR